MQQRKFNLLVETFYPDFNFLVMKKAAMTDSFCTFQLHLQTTVMVREFGDPSTLLKVTPTPSP